jgi:hypothetical protein
MLSFNSISYDLKGRVFLPVEMNIECVRTDDWVAPAPALIASLFASSCLSPVSLSDYQPIPKFDYQPMPLGIGW